MLAPSIERFLVVDDDARVLVAQARTLAALGEVVPASTYDDGTLLAVSEHWTGLVVDLYLGEQSGFDVVRAARGVDAVVPAVVVTASDSPAHNSEALSLGVDFLRKPFAPRALREWATRAITCRASADYAIGRALAHAQAVARLTPAEVDVLRLAVEGRNRAEIESVRDVSKATLDSQVKSILSKTGARALDVLIQEILRDATHRK